MIDNYSEIVPETYYHIFNRANGNEKLFLSEDNYHYFLKRYKDFIQPICETHAYCLMPNHFHFLIQVKRENDILEHLKTLQGYKTIEDLKNKNISRLLSQQFSNFLNSYTQAFNKQHNRKGSLFMRSYKRKIITSDAYKLKTVHYIHFNAVEAGLCDLPEQWPYCSFSNLLNKQNDFFVNKETIEWFGSKENFLHTHRNSNFKPNIDVII